MLRGVRIEGRVGIDEAEPPAERLDVVTPSGEEQPARLHSVRGSIASQHRGCVLLGL